VSLVNLKPHEEHMGVAKKPHERHMGVEKKLHEERMGVVFLAPPEQKATLFSSSRNLVGVAKKPHEERMRLQLHYSTVNDARSFTVYFIGKYGESCFFPVFPDLPGQIRHFRVSQFGKLTGGRFIKSGARLQNQETKINFKYLHKKTHNIFENQAINKVFIEEINNGDSINQLHS
jgi:hypothetical protein